MTGEEADIRARGRLPRCLLPSITLVATSLLILLFSGDLSISAAGWKIYIGPVLWTIVLLIPAILLVKSRGEWTGNTRPMIEVPEDWFSLTTKTWWYLGIVLVSRQLMIWQFYNPWEKLPVALMILLQVLLVERVSTRDVGLGDWNRWNVALAMIVVGIDLALVNLGGFGLNLVLLGPDAINNLVIDYPGQLYLASFPYQFLAVAFAEELLFRGYLYTKLRIKTRQAGRGDRWSMVTSVLVTSVLFGLFHVPWYLRPVSPGDGFGFYLPADLVLPCIRRVVSTGLFGVLMAFLYEKTGSILAPMIIHGASNSIQPLLTFSGGAGPGDTLAGIVIPWSGTILVAAHLMLVIAIWKPLARRWKWMLAARKPWSDDGRVQPREP